MPGRVTIKDVALDAGVSIKTVSNVLNDSGRMRPETRRKVQASVRNLGYQVNPAARSLKTGASNLLGLAIFNFSQPFAAYFTEEVIGAARDRGYGLTVTTYDTKDRSSTGLEEIVPETYRLAADGWLFFANKPLSVHSELLQQSYPIVLVGDYSAHNQVDSVTMKNEASIYETTLRLLQSGSKRIALVGAPYVSADERLAEGQILNMREGTAALRTKGYVKAILDSGNNLEWRLIISTSVMDSASGRESVARLFESGESPDAIICLNDALAFGVVSELRMRKVRIPEDIQVIGFDNVDEAQYSYPPLTTIDPDIRGYANHAVSMLVERVEGHKGPAREYITDFSLVERGTTRLS